MDDKEMVATLREYGRTLYDGKMGSECVVEKAFLNMVAARLEELSLSEYNHEYHGLAADLLGKNCGVGAQLIRSFIKG